MSRYLVFLVLLLVSFPAHAGSHEYPALSAIPPIDAEIREVRAAHIKILDDGPFTAAEIVRLTNESRREAALPDLAVNHDLTESASAKAHHMATFGYFAHNSPDGLEPWDFFRYAGYRYYFRAGENLATRFTVASEMQAAWMASPAHRANVLDARWEEIGVAVHGGLVVVHFGDR